MRGLRHINIVLLATIVMLSATLAAGDLHELFGDVVTQSLAREEGELDYFSGFDGLPPQQNSTHSKKKRKHDDDLAAQVAAEMLLYRMIRVAAGFYVMRVELSNLEDSLYAAYMGRMTAAARESVQHKTERTLRLLSLEILRWLTVYDRDYGEALLLCKSKQCMTNLRDAALSMTDFAEFIFTGRRDYFENTHPIVEAVLDLSIAYEIKPEFADVMKIVRQLRSYWYRTNELVDVTTAIIGHGSHQISYNRETEDEVRITHQAQRQWLNDMFQAALVSKVHHDADVEIPKTKRFGYELTLKCKDVVGATLLSGVHWQKNRIDDYLACDGSDGLTYKVKMYSLGVAVNLARNNFTIKITSKHPITFLGTWSGIEAKIGCSLGIGAQKLIGKKRSSAFVTEIGGLLGLSLSYVRLVVAQ